MSKLVVVGGLLVTECDQTNFNGWVNEVELIGVTADGFYDPCYHEVISLN